MESGQPFIRLKLDIDEPIELSEFMAAFLAISSQYERYAQSEQPKGSGGAKLFVREVRVGCIEADLIPLFVGGGVVGSALLLMQAANTVHDFVEKYGGTLKRLGRREGERLEGATKSQLTSLMGQVAAVASVPGSSLTLSAMSFRGQLIEATAVHQLSTVEARQLIDNAGAQKLELSATTDADHQRVLMRLTRTDTRRVKIGKKAVEHAVIEKVGGKDLAVIYASDLVEARIRHEIVSESENVYWKGFIVDVNVEFSQGRPVAYRVTHVHDVIDLPRDDED